jgi:hypothetical protein
MGGMPMIADLSDSQLQGLAGGPTLQSVCMNLAASASRKPCRRLKDALIAGIDGRSMLLPLYILICQQVDHSLFYDPDPFNPAPLKVTDTRCALKDAVSVARASGS